MVREQDIPFGATDKETLPFPEDGHTLFVNSIGQRGAFWMTQFLNSLKGSHGSKELLAASSFGIHQNMRGSIEKAMGAGLFNKPTVVFNDSEDAIAAFNRQSERHGNTGRAVLHFLSYERGTGGLINQTREAFLKGLPDVLHLGIVFTPPNLVSKTYAQKEMAQYSPHWLDSSWMRTIIIDRYPQPSQSQKPLTESEVVYGLAGLVASHRVFPRLNPYNYLELLQLLIDPAPLMIGVSVGRTTTPMLREQGLPYREVTSRQDLEDKTGQAMALSFAQDASMTEDFKAGNAKMNLVATQIPLNSRHPGWQESKFIRQITSEMKDFAQRKDILIGDNTVFVYSPADPEVGSDKQMPIVAVNFYPVRM